MQFSVFESHELVKFCRAFHNSIDNCYRCSAEIPHITFPTPEHVSETITIPEAESNLPVDAPITQADCTDRELFVFRLFNIMARYFTVNGHHFNFQLGTRIRRYNETKLSYSDYPLS